MKPEKKSTLDSVTWRSQETSSSHGVMGMGAGLERAQREGRASGNGEHADPSRDLSL